MPYQRKYDFRPGTPISSNQVDEEFDNLINAVNTLETEKPGPQEVDKQISKFLPTQESLWSGAALIVGTTTITPSKKLSECRNGWILVWCDYDPGVGANNSNFAYAFIPKQIASTHNGVNHNFDVLAMYSDTYVRMTGKTVSVYDDKITGNDQNNSTSTYSDDVCLRYVWAF